jgi:hypothetical protein
MAARHAVICAHLGKPAAPAWVGAREGWGPTAASPGPVPKFGVGALRNQSRHRGCFFSHLLRQPAIIWDAPAARARHDQELCLRWDRQAERRSPESRETWGRGPAVLN